MVTNSERQAARIMVSGAFSVFWNALGHLVRVYFDYLTGWAPRLARDLIARLPSRRQLLGRHTGLAWGLAFGFGVLGGMNICVAAIYVAHVAVGAG